MQGHQHSHPLDAGVIGHFRDASPAATNTSRMQGEGLTVRPSQLLNERPN